MIRKHLQNWELERVINMDMLLMEMALCELLEFPSVPIKVTLNEYIELAKWYSSDKSKVFIDRYLRNMSLTETAKANGTTKKTICQTLKKFEKN